MSVIVGNFLSEAVFTIEIKHLASLPVLIIFRLSAYCSFYLLLIAAKTFANVNKRSREQEEIRNTAVLPQNGLLHLLGNPTGHHLCIEGTHPYHILKGRGIRLVTKATVKEISQAVNIPLKTCRNGFFIMITLKIIILL